MRRGEARPRSQGVVSWELWDWGSEAFNAVVTTFVFTVYLTSSAFGDANTTSAALGAGMAVAGAAIALVAPVVGQSADRSGRTTFWLGVNSVILTVLMLALYFVRPDPAYLWLGVALVAVGNVVFEFASVNYNALLPVVARPENIGRVSALGWGAGYLGGIVLLLILVIGFINPQVGWFGVTPADGENVRVGMVLSAVWFAVAAVPVLAIVGLHLPAIIKERKALTSPEDPSLNPKFWVWGGFFYNNPNDARAFVPKPPHTGTGLTMNLATAWGKLVVALIVLVFVGTLVLMFVL